MRVVVSQFATSLNTQENLATCVRMINEAVVCEPCLIVLPEFCNTLFCNEVLDNAQPWYVDHSQAWNEALTLNGTFLQGIAEQAKNHDCYIVIGVTLRQDALRVYQDGSIKSYISVTSCLFSPLGELIQQADKQVLTGYENEFFISASKVAEVVTTPFGTLGLLTGSDDITFETSRRLALGGAQLLCHSMNSFSMDQNRLHGPVRSCENNVFLAAANKVGSLIPQQPVQEQPQDHIQQEKAATCPVPSLIAQKILVGVGQSQIVSPDGKILAKMDNNEEGFVFADIDLAGAGFNNKCRPDGTELAKQRRPELYQRLSLPMEHANKHEKKVPVTANIAIFATYKSSEQAIEDVCHYIENNLSDVIQLPELFFLADKTISHHGQQIASVARLSQRLINQVSTVLRPFQYVCTSLVIDGMHQAVLISEYGLFATQQQLHFCQRHQWTALGDEVKTIELPLEQGSINVAMLTADDANIPEIVKITALNGIHLLLIPFDIQEPCEVEYSLLSRAAENRICIVAASREKSFSNDFSTDNTLNSTNIGTNNNIDNQNKNKKKLKPQKSTGLIASLTPDLTLLTRCKADKFNGYINPPLVKHQHGKITKAVIHPIAAVNKLIASKNI